MTTWPATKDNDQTEVAAIPVLLTFDDGPHAGGTSSNLTRNIVATLKANAVQNGIVSVFFVQSHARENNGTGAEMRFGHPQGEAASLAAAADGHLIQIHTGSDIDHALHTSRVLAAPYNVTGSTAPDGQNALESDLIRAKLRIKDKTGAESKYVRAVELARNASVNATYGRQSLKHIGVNVDGKDGGSASGSTPDGVKSKLRNGPTSVKTAIQNGAVHLIVLFHDTNSETAAHLSDYLQVIKEECQSIGGPAAFVTSTATAQQILDSTIV